MRRKSLLFALGLLLLLAGAGGTTLVALVRHEPTFYRETQVSPGYERQKKSGEFLTRFCDLMNSITNNEDRWGDVFTADQINSYFQEDFARNAGGESILPEGFHEPRISIEPDKIKLAFRYGNGTWSTVVSIDLHVWLVAKEPNVVAVELEGLHAGMLPISPQSLLDYVTESARHLNIEVTWYRHRGNPVALLRFQADQLRPSAQLTRLELKEGEIIIVGRSTEPSLSRTAMKPDLGP